MPEPTDPDTTRTLSRRRLSLLSGGAAAAGAAWTSGLAVSTKGWRPQVSVLGERDWQVLLLDHRGNRTLILAGDFEESPVPAIDRLCGVVRQHVDIVAGSRDALGLLPPDFPDRRAVATIVELDPPPGLSNSPSYIGLDDPISIRAGSMEIELVPHVEGAWKMNGSQTRAWVGRVIADRVTVEFGSSLETLSRLGWSNAALAIAPGGDVAGIWRATPGIAVATNTRQRIENLASTGGVRHPTTLIRIFPEAVATFRFRNGRLVLPEWVERQDAVDSRD